MNRLQYKLSIIDSDNDDLNPADDRLGAEITVRDTSDAGYIHKHCLVDDPVLSDGTFTDVMICNLSDGSATLAWNDGSDDKAVTVGAGRFVVLPLIVVDGDIKHDSTSLDVYALVG